MLEVQAAHLGHHQGPGTASSAFPERLLEDSDGVVRLYYCDEVAADTCGVVECLRYKHPKATWLQWNIEHLLWRRASAFKLLQGASLQQLVGLRYVMTYGDSRPLYNPSPGVDHIELCELLEAPSSLSRRTFFELVLSLRTSLPRREG